MLLATPRDETAVAVDVVERPRADRIASPDLLVRACRSADRAAWQDAYASDPLAAVAAWSLTECAVKLAGGTWTSEAERPAVLPVPVHEEPVEADLLRSLTAQLLPRRDWRSAHIDFHQPAGRPAPARWAYDAERLLVVAVRSSAREPRAAL